MTYAVSLSETNPRISERFSTVSAGLGRKSASRRDRTRARRTALAMSEEARINAQMAYRRMRYRHMAS